jgi:hypothetical protein
VTLHHRFRGRDLTGEALEVTSPGIEECNRKVRPPDLGKVGLRFPAAISKPHSARDASACVQFECLRLDHDFDAWKRSHRCNSSNTNGVWLTPKLSRRGVPVHTQRVYRNDRG